MKKHTQFGKVIFWLGFFLFVLGVFFNERVGTITDPQIFSSFSLPAILTGIVLLVISNFFIKESIS